MPRQQTTRVHFLVFPIVSLGLAVPAQAQTIAAEVSFWNSVKDSNDPKEIEAYLDTFPEGQFEKLAKLRLQKLRSAGKVQPSLEEQKKAELAALQDRAEAGEANSLAPMPLATIME